MCWNNFSCCILRFHITEGCAGSAPATLAMHLANKTIPRLMEHPMQLDDLETTLRSTHLCRIDRSLLFGQTQVKHTGCQILGESMWKSSNTPLHLQKIVDESQHSNRVRVLCAALIGHQVACCKMPAYWVKLSMWVSFKRLLSHSSLRVKEGDRKDFGLSQHYRCGIGELHIQARLHQEEFLWGNLGISLPSKCFHVELTPWEEKKLKVPRHDINQSSKCFMSPMNHVLSYNLLCS